MKKLTDKQKKAVDIYLINGMNKTQALIDAGYSQKYANANINSVFAKPEVQAYLQQKQEENQKKIDINQEWLLKEYLQLIESAKFEGIPMGERGSMKDRVNWAKALAQLSKLLGLDEPDKQEIKHTGLEGFQVNIKNSKKDD